jgi:hypothetical protein
LVQGDQEGLESNKAGDVENKSEHGNKHEGFHRSVGSVNEMTHDEREATGRLELECQLEHDHFCRSEFQSEQGKNPTAYA